jgi:predicted DNA-binding protein (UPF0251 family)
MRITKAKEGSQMNDVVHIYGLLDPRDQQLRYVGKTIHPSKRLREHLNQLDNTPKGEWLLELTKSGFKPKLIVFSEVSKADASKAEKEAIRRYALLGCPLLNTHGYPTSQRLFTDRYQPITQFKIPERIDWQRFNYRTELDTIKREFFRLALLQGTVAKAAKMLGVSRQYLESALKEEYPELEVYAHRGKPRGVNAERFG